VAGLIYASIASVDGYIADVDGRFDWAAPDEEMHVLVNDLMRSVDTHLFGRRMYEVLAAWESDELVAGQPRYISDYATIWRSADKIVYSRTLAAPSTARTIVKREFDAEEVRALKTTRNLSISGPELAGHALKGGLVDELHIFQVPVVVGGGKRFLPDGLFTQLELMDQRRLGSGAVYMRYQIGTERKRFT
jgi:dihydrofolate reductase